MNTQIYDDIVASYKKRQQMKLLISFGAMVLGFLLSATGVGAIVGIAAMIYLMIEAVRTFGTANVRKTSMKELQSKGLHDAAMLALQQAERQQMDGLTYAWTSEFFCTGYGAIFSMQKIAWIYPFTHTVRYMMIPIVRQHWCKILMLDGTERLAFYGKVKDQSAFERMLKGMRSVNPELQIGHTPENVELYKQRVMLYKAAEGK